VARSVWDAVVLVLKCPHFSNTKKMELVHQKNLPVIYDYACPPRVPPFRIRRHVPKPPDGVRVNVYECVECFCTDTMIVDRQELLVCTHCGTTAIAPESYDYRRASRKLVLPRKHSANYYKREVHFRSWLARLQGKESRRVPYAVIDQVRELFVKDGIKSVHYWIVRGALKKLKLTRWYGNVVQIMKELRGKPLFELTARHEQELLCLFLSLRNVFDKVADNKRVNMLHYPYVIRKLCEQMGWYGMARVIPMLKSTTRIQSQDAIWREVCAQKGWDFKPTAPHTKLDNRSPYAIRI